MQKFLKLENMTFLGAILGILAGLFLPGLSQNISLIGDLFIILLKMIIVPLVLVSVFLAVGRQESIYGLSRLGARTSFYFFITSSLACITGFVAALILPESTERNFRFQNYDPGKLGSVSFKDVILNFFSANPFKSLAEGNIIQIVVLALILGIATLQIRDDRRKIIVNGFEAVDELVMVIVRWVLLLAPIGVFSLVATVVAKTDKSAFTGLGQLFLAIALAMLIHTLITLPCLGYFFGKFNPYKFLINVKRVLLVALATASSSATLPVSTEVMEEKENVDPKTAGFVLPLGATVNMDGSSIYQTLIVLYFADLAGIPINFTQQLYIFFLILISSVGTAGIPGGGILMLGAVLQNVGVPLEYLGLYLLIDRLWDPPVTMINVLGDLFGAKIIDRYQKIKG
jgi:Na+/H+-dicarboxylate symporter